MEEVGVMPLSSIEGDQHAVSRWQDAVSLHFVLAADSIWNVRLTRCSRASGSCSVGRSGSRGNPRHEFKRDM